MDRSTPDLSSTPAVPSTTTLAPVERTSTLAAALIAMVPAFVHVLLVPSSQMDCVVAASTGIPLESTQCGPSAVHACPALTQSASKFKATRSPLASAHEPPVENIPTLAAAMTSTWCAERLTSLSASTFKATSAFSVTDCCASIVTVPVSAFKRTSPADVAHVWPATDVQAASSIAATELPLASEHTPPATISTLPRAFIRNEPSAALTSTLFCASTTMSAVEDTSSTPPVPWTLTLPTPVAVSVMSLSCASNSTPVAPTSSTLSLVDSSFSL